VSQLEKVIESIDNSLKTLVALEVKHTQTATALERAFGEIEKHNTRLKCMEVEMPTIKLVRGWVITGVIAMVGLLGVEIINLATQNAQASQAHGRAQ
jgi:hypothetical protein